MQTEEFEIGDLAISYGNFHIVLREDNNPKFFKTVCFYEKKAWPGGTVFKEIKNGILDYVCYRVVK